MVDDRTRTDSLQCHKLTLYQLSYADESKNRPIERKNIKSKNILLKKVILKNKRNIENQNFYTQLNKKTLMA